MCGVLCVGCCVWGVASMKYRLVVGFERLGVCLRSQDKMCPRCDGCEWVHCVHMTATYVHVNTKPLPQAATQL